MIWRTPAAVPPSGFSKRSLTGSKRTIELVDQSLSHTRSEESTHTAYARAVPGSLHSRQLDDEGS